MVPGSRKLRPELAEITNCDAPHVAGDWAANQPLTRLHCYQTLGGSLYKHSVSQPWAPAGGGSPLAPAQEGRGPRLPPVQACSAHRGLHADGRCCCVHASN